MSEQREQMIPLDVVMELAALLQAHGFATKYPACTKSILDNAFAGFRTCRNCGTGFEPPRKERMVRYCSDECRRASSNLRQNLRKRHNRSPAVPNGEPA